MMRKTWLVNMALCGCAILLTLAAWRVWTADPSPDAPLSTNGDAGFRPPVMPPPLGDRGAYREVTERNLFSPDRRMPAVEALPEPPPPEAPKPEVKTVAIAGKTITLYGVVITDTGRRALISDPKPENPKRAQKWVREGDEVDNLVVAAIDAKKLVLREGDKLHEILLHAQKERRTEPSPPAAEKSSQPRVVSTEPAKPKPHPSEPAAPAGTAASSGSGGTGGDDAQYEIVKTPFGNVKRRK